MKIFICHQEVTVTDKKKIFILTRPFFSDNKWVDDSSVHSNFGINSDEYGLTKTIENATIVLIPHFINSYFQKKEERKLRELNSECLKYNIKAYGFISGDLGMAFPEFSNIIYFRLGGEDSQLSANNKGFPVALSDHFQRLYQIENPIPKDKAKLPIIGFCGHASRAPIKRGKEIVKNFIENANRFLKNPFRGDWEPLFASAYERARLLSYLENDSSIATNFIYREHYRGGARTDIELEKTTLEYYDNIAGSDYILCVRGAGNFSVRLYETLMMGKIPIFVNTDCLLPFPSHIDWKKHTIWVEWKDRKRISSVVSDFHQSISEDDFIRMQLENRRLWKETLSVAGLLKFLTHDF